MTAATRVGSHVDIEELPAPATSEKDLLRFIHGGQRGRRQVHADRPAAVRFQGRVRRPACRHQEGSANRPDGSAIDFSLLTDGLRAEREQGITIDVAYRYFATPKRKFIIADTPGHEQYTRNMATGASTADLAIILIDARKGVLPQSRRHAFIASLLGIRHVVVAVNKMDLVDYSEEVFDAICADFSGFAAQLQVPDLYFMPDQRPARRKRRYTKRADALVSGREPAAITSKRSTSRATGISRKCASRCSSFFVRTSDFRGYAGQVASGVLKPGDPVMVLPSGRTSPREVDRDERRRDGAGLPADVGHGVPGRRSRHQPRRHAGAAFAPAARDALHRRAPRLDGRRAARPPPAVPDPAYDAGSQGAGPVHSISRGCQHLGAASCFGITSERDRRGGYRHSFPACSSISTGAIARPAVSSWSIRFRMPRLQQAWSRAAIRGRVSRRSPTAGCSKRGACPNPNGVSRVGHPAVLIWMNGGSEEAFVLEQELFRLGYLTHVIAARMDASLLMELVHHLTAAGLVTICAAGPLYDIERERAQAVIDPSRFIQVDAVQIGTPAGVTQAVLSELTSKAIEPTSR